MSFHDVSYLFLFTILLGVSLAQGPSEVLSFDYQVFAPNDIAPTGPISPIITAARNPADSSIWLCGQAPSQVGGVWYLQQLQVRGFKVVFTFNKTQGGEGFAFVIQNVSTLANGPLGSGLGYGDNTERGTAGIQGSVAIEVDTHYDADLGDPVQDHTGVHFNPSSNSGPNSAYESAAHGGASVSGPQPIAGQNVITIVYQPNGAGSGGLNLTWNTLGGPSLSSDFLLESVSTLSLYGKAWIGFTATTGSDSVATKLLTWSYEFLGRLNPAKSVILNAGSLTGQAGIPVSIYIQGFDQYGNEMITGDTIINWGFSLSTEPGLQSTATDLHNGTYRIDFTPTIASTTIEMTISMNGTNVEKSPALLKVSPGMAVPNMTVARAVAGETGLVGGPAGAPMQFQVQLFDAFNNSVTDLGNQQVSLQGRLTGRLTEDVQFGSPVEGVYAASYNLTKTGIYQLEITMNGQPIKTPNFNIKIDAAAVDGSQTLTSGPPNLFIAGVNVDFYLQLRDTFGNNITNTPTPAPNIAVTMGGGYTSTVTEIQGGLYKVSGTATIVTVALQQLTVTVDGKNIPGSPWTIQIQPASDVYAPNCLASGNNLYNSVAGNQSLVVVDTRDYYNNQMATEDKGLRWDVRFEKDNVTVPSVFQVRYINQGDYLIIYNITKAGNFSMHISINGTAIQSSPFAVENVANVAYGPNCVTDGQSLLLYTDQEETFTIVTHDAYNNPIPHGGFDFRTSLTDNVSGATLATPDVRDDDNGRYFVNFTIQHSGMYTLKVSVEELDIAGSPFVIKVKWAGLPTPAVIAIGVGCAVFVLLIGLGVWFYQTKWKKRKQYMALRDTEPTPGDVVDNQL